MTGKKYAPQARYEAKTRKRLPINLNRHEKEAGALSSGFFFCGQL